jgi:cold shock CspA family protein
VLNLKKYLEINPLLQRMTLVLLTLILLWGTGIPAYAAEAPVAKPYVYYTVGSDLYRVSSSGTDQQLITSDYEGVYPSRGGNYLYYYEHADSNTLMRVAVNGEASLAPAAFATDVNYYLIDSGFVYYLTAKGAIYRAPVNAFKSSEAKLVADKVDGKNPSFHLKQGRIVYHSLKNNKPWVVTKNADGTGQPVWIASGVLHEDGPTADTNFLYLAVDTKPEITNIAVDSYILYMLPIKGGVVKAVNAKYPLNYNWAASGQWLTGGGYVYNKNIGLDLEGIFDYTTGTGFILGTNGKAVQVHKNPIEEAFTLDANRIAFRDATGKAYISTLKDNKLVSTKTLPLTNTYYIDQLYSQGKVSATLFFTEGAVYKLAPDVSVKQVIDADWSVYITNREVPGFFYINQDDNDTLYWTTGDGKINKSLETGPVDALLAVAQQ